MQGGAGIQRLKHRELEKRFVKAPLMCSCKFSDPFLEEKRKRELTVGQLLSLSYHEANMELYHVAPRVRIGYKNE